MAGARIRPRWRRLRLRRRTEVGQPRRHRDGTDLAPARPRPRFPSRQPSPWRHRPRGSQPSRDGERAPMRPRRSWLPMRCRRHPADARDRTAPLRYHARSRRPRGRARQSRDGGRDCACRRARRAPGTEEGADAAGPLPKSDDGPHGPRVMALDVGEALRRAVWIGGIEQGSTAAAPGNHAEERAPTRSAKSVDTNFVSR